MNLEELSERIVRIEEKNKEIEAGLWGIIENMQKNAQIIEAIQETFQNIDAYLRVNVGPPLFIDEGN